jgi:hypothetical protein
MMSVGKYGHQIVAHSSGKNLKVSGKAGKNRALAIDKD